MISYTLDPARGLVCIRMAVEVTPQDMRTVVDRLRADESLDKTWPVLIDTREVTKLPRYADMRQLVSISAKSPTVRSARRAFVVNTSALFGVARMASTLAQALGREYRVFDNTVEAERWLFREEGPGQ